MCSFGALIGKVTPTQLLWLLLIEVPLYAINARLASSLGALDVGGSITIHAFGAYYGLAASLVDLIALHLAPRLQFAFTHNSLAFCSDSAFSKELIQAGSSDPFTGPKTCIISRHLATAIHRYLVI